MKVNVQKLVCLLSVLSICAGILLTGCSTPGNAGGEGSPSPKETTTASVEPSAQPKAEEKTISAQADSPVRESWTEVDKYSTDLDGDKKKETVALFVNAQKDGEGELQKNDGQEWVLRVEADGKYYTLFEEYVQNGNVYFEVSDYYVGNDAVPVITLVKSTGSEFKLMRYSFEKEKAVFAQETVYDSAAHSKDGINRRYSSIPAVK